MPEDVTANCDLPLLLPAQAQKHVTVNDALMRLDGQLDLVLQSLTRIAPPETVLDGLCWSVPQGAVNAWEGQAGKIAIGANGGWVFVQPAYGRRAVIADQGVAAIHDGTFWVAGAVTLGQNGAGMMARLLSEDVVLGAGAWSETSMMIPAGALVIGVTGRVLEAITGSATSWTLGTAGSTETLHQFGQGLGKAAGSWLRGLLSPPVAFWQPTALRLTAAEGAFAGGRVRLALHWWELRLPD
jgi:hypothetical protein